MPDLSLVIPLLNEEESLRPLMEQIRGVLASQDRTYEVIFIDDGSTDGSLAVLEDLHNTYPEVKVIQFRRNFGKAAAYTAGFQRARGTYIITMDADLQDDPAEIPNLLAKIEEGYDLVSGWKKKRFDPLGKTLPSKFFNWVTGRVSGIDIHDFNCGLKIYRSEVTKDIRVLGELHRYIPVLAHLEGYRIGEIPVQHHPRQYGVTKYGWGRLLKGFFDLLTVMYIGKYMGRPTSPVRHRGPHLWHHRHAHQRIHRIPLVPNRHHSIPLSPAHARGLPHRTRHNSSRPARRHADPRTTAQRKIQHSKNFLNASSSPAAWDL